MPVVRSLERTIAYSSLDRILTPYTYFGVVFIFPYKPAGMTHAPGFLYKSIGYFKNTKITPM